MSQAVNANANPENQKNEGGKVDILRGAYVKTRVCCQPRELMINLKRSARPYYAERGNAGEARMQNAEAVREVPPDELRVKLFRSMPTARAMAEVETQAKSRGENQAEPRRCGARSNAARRKNGARYEPDARILSANRCANAQNATIKRRQ
jgi:hypothetical protein